MKFLEHWRPKFGTNCKSPASWAKEYPGSSQPKSAPTQTRNDDLQIGTVLFQVQGQSPESCFTGLRADIDDPTHFTLRNFGIYISNELGQVIDSDTQTTKGFMAMLVFEVMDDQKPHEKPFYRFPTIGPYHETTGVNSLGLRVE